MIYLKNITDAQSLFIPKSGATPSGTLLFEAISTIDLESHILQEVVDLNTSGLYYNIAVTLPAYLPDGEYEYTLSDGNNLLSTGFLILGESATPSQYEKEITYEQYTTE